METTQGNSGLVVGLFAKREQAHRAVTELREIAIEPSAIRAAYHSEAAHAVFDPATNPGARAVEEYDPTTYPHGPTTTLTGASPFARSDQEISWQEDPSTEAAGVTADPPATGEQLNYEEHDVFSMLVAVGVASAQARSLADSVPPGGAVVTVHAAERLSEARDVLQRNEGRIA